ncbi:2488_t:CDS:1, partial [Entrophospora sp. SA101]
LKYLSMYCPELMDKLQVSKEWSDFSTFKDMNYSMPMPLELQRFID